MIQQILSSNFESHQQQAFSLIPFINRANYFAGGHPLIVDTLRCLPEGNTVDRIQLLNTYNNKEIPFYSKVLLTFWWGGLSHQYQAPLFYKKSNLDRIVLFSDQLQADLNKCVNNDIRYFKKSLADIFHSLNYGEYKMDGINLSYFTKIFQFFFQQAYEIRRINYLPIIADKWSMRAVFSLMLYDGFDYSLVFKNPKIQNEKDIKIDFISSKDTLFNSYWNFITYFEKKVNELRNNTEFKDLTPFRLEEILFGKANSWGNKNNPRRICSELIYCKLK